eukprot:1843916-Karenia_brevis.AAC.1
MDKDPVRQVVCGSKSQNNPENNRDDARLNAPTKFRVGRPRCNWARTHLGFVWDQFKELGGFTAQFNYKKTDHLNFLEDIAWERLF